MFYISNKVFIIINTRTVYHVFWTNLILIISVGFIYISFSGACRLTPGFDVRAQHDPEIVCLF